MPYHTLPNETELLRQVSEGDHDAYKTLFRFYMPQIRELLEITTKLCRQDADEMVQLTMIKVWENREKMCIVKSFGGYLSAMAKNTYKARLRKKNKTVNVRQALGEDGEPVTNSLEDDLQYKTYLDRARDAIRMIPEIRRSIVQASWLEGHSRQQAAKKFSISEVAVKKHLIKGKVFIISYLRQHTEWMLLIFITGF